MPRARRIAVLVSGGYDSAALVGWALRSGRRALPIYVRQGLRWERAETHWLRRFLRETSRRLRSGAIPARGGAASLEPLRVLDLPAADLYRGHWSLSGPVPGRGTRDAAVFLPGRNLMLLSKAALLCAMEGIEAVAIGTLKGNPFGDATGAFRSALGRAVLLATGRRVRILAPFARRTKAEAAAFARGLPLALAFSCLAPRGLSPCGRCNKCAEAAALGVEPRSVPPVRCRPKGD